MMGVAYVIGAILGMDLIDTKIGADKVTYVYRSCGLTARKKIQEIKAKIMSILSPPADIPIDIRVYPEKKGLILKGYIVEVDVPMKKFEVK